MKSKRLVLLGVLTAAMIAAKEVLAFLPNIELVTLFVMTFTIALGWDVLYVIVTFVLVEVLLYGMSSWVLMYLYIWPLLAWITRLLRRNESVLVWAVTAGGFGLGFGALCSLTYLFLTGPAGAAAYWFAGIPFDILHGISNFVLVFLLWKPMTGILNKIEGETR